MNFKDVYIQTNSNLFLFGELHGTKEMPQIFINAIKDVLTLNKHINIFLEVSSKLQALFNDYKEDKISYKNFLNERMYSNEGYDGRGSKAFFQIFNFAKENKDRINIYGTISGNKKSDNCYIDYETCMKDCVCKYYNKNAINFYYAGANHVVTNEILDTNQWRLFEKNGYLPCGYLIKKEIPCAISIRLKELSGKVIAKNCSLGQIEKSKVSYVKLKNIASKAEMFDEYIKTSNDVYDYYYYIKRVTPSYKLR